MHPLEVITSFWYPNIIWGKKLLYSHFSAICQGGRNGYIAIFRGEIYYIAIFPPIQLRGTYGYIAIFPGGWLWGGNGSITPVRKISSSYEGFKTKQVTVLLSNRKARKRYALILSELSEYRLYFSRFIWLINYQSSSIQQ
jgi:hypothetical protein